MNTSLFRKSAATWSHVLSCIALLVLIGCGKTTDSPADSAATKRNETSTPATNDATLTEPDAVAKEFSADKVQPAAQQPPAKAPADVAKFMKDAHDGDTKTLKQAIESGVDVNTVDEEKRTALMFAGFNGHTETVKMLLKHGAKISDRDSMGRTALMFAATGDNAAACQALLDAGSDVNATDTGEGFTSLMYAAAEGQLEVVKLLLKHDADRDRRDIDGDTAKTFAEKNGHAEVVRVLSE